MTPQDYLKEKLAVAVEALKPIINKSVNHTLCQCEWDEEGYQLANDPDCLHNKAKDALDKIEKGGKG